MFHYFPNSSNQISPKISKECMYVRTRFISVVIVLEIYNFGLQTLEKWDPICRDARRVLKNELNNVYMATIYPPITTLISLRP